MPRRQIVMVIAVVTVAYLAVVTIGVWPKTDKNPKVKSDNDHPLEDATQVATENSTLPPAMSLPAVSPSSIRITVVGDIMLDRYVRTTIRQRGPLFPFEPVRSLLVGDIVMGNLEGPFTNAASIATNERLIFTFDPALAPVLANVGFTHVSLANNHTLNFGQAGLDQTRTVTQAAGLVPFGDPKNRHGFGAIASIGATPIALIGYHQFNAGFETIVDDVREAVSNGYFTIVMAHWGSEYSQKVTARQRQEAHVLIDAGAELVIGAHPHVIEPIEIYQGKLVVFSLGNFLFDQYFSTDTQRGLMLTLDVKSGFIDSTFVPLVMDRGQIRPADAQERQNILTRLADTSFIPDDKRNTILQGTLTLP